MATETGHAADWKKTARGLLLLVAVYCVVAYLIPRPEGVKPEGWRLTGIFLATIVGSIIEPIPGGALVLLAVTLASVSGAMTIDQALMGYSNKYVWLVIAAFIISRALINTGLARRIALFFVRLVGKSSLGVAYSLALSDCVLAGVIPSNGARSGGVILPIVRSISELYGSKPGPTSGVLGSFLIAAVYQSVCITSAMFYTGQASNPIAAKLAADQGYIVTWVSWLQASIVPGLLSLIAVPWVVMRMTKPTVQRTPEAAAFAMRELTAMGPLSRNEKILTLVFVGVCGFWISYQWTKIDFTVTALFGALAVLVTGVLSWDDVKGERAAWDLFVWYGGLLRLGQGLDDYGVTRAFANAVANQFGGLGWVGLFVIALLIYFYAHYAFASITVHIQSMFPAFLAVLIHQGAPKGLMVMAFACLANLSAGLTNYGTTPAPMFFATEYVTLKRWWTVGAVVSVVNILIWTTFGFAWWKLIGIW
jgi:DASS family divalent anion:Na+ symporter